MANYNGGRVLTEKLNGSNADLCLMSAAGEAIIVSNISGEAPIYFTVDKPGGPCPVPTVNGSTCFAVAGTGNRVSVRHDGMYGSVVQLISSASVQYTIEVGSRQVNV
jgi:hypothetical protein